MKNFDEAMRRIFIQFDEKRTSAHPIVYMLTQQQCTSALLGQTDETHFVLKNWDQVGNISFYDTLWLCNNRPWKISTPATTYGDDEDDIFIESLATTAVLTNRIN